MVEEVILVDENDNEVGTEEKIAAHKNGGKLHRAFSILIFNSKGEMLIHQRAKTKYHFGGLWTNACCSHSREGEKTIDAAHRRLQEEFGFDTDMKEILSFVYRADSDGELSEYEFDHVFVGNFDGEPKPNPEEIDDYRWITVDELEKDVKENPEKYTPWFKIILSKAMEQIRK